LIKVQKFFWSTLSSSGRRQATGTIFVEIMY
jgi:hypothetical protein